MTYADIVDMQIEARTGYKKGTAGRKWLVTQLVNPDGSRMSYQTMTQKLGGFIIGRSIPHFRVQVNRILDITWELLQEHLNE